MMRFTLGLFASVYFAASSSAMTITSPDGNVQVEVKVNAGQLNYRVRLEGNALLVDSPLGLKTSAGDFQSGLELVNESEVTQIEHEYVLPIGKQRDVTYQANRATITVANPEGQKLSVVFQVSNDGVALTYVLYFAEDQAVVVERESTGFALPEGTTSFLHPMHVARTGWMRTYPSYEAHYEIDQPVGRPSTDGVGWCFPALFKVGDRGWILVSETGVDGGYCGTKLDHDSTGGVYRIGFPQEDENLPSDPIEPTVAGNAQLPWRIIIAGKTLATLVESTLATDVVEPKFDAPESVVPGKAAWSWLFLKDDYTVYETQREFIDMAADLHFEYTLIDSMWDQQIGREKIAELVEYARDRGVRILLWYNSNGPWNDAPMTPKHRMYEQEVRREEMAWLKQVGVAGVKVDFFGGDKQAGMAFYEELLRDAAEHELSVNFHGTTLPRGWHRMYPNFVTSEAVFGMEFCTFDQANADRQAQHCTILPFVRNVVGPMDFTPTILAERLGPAGTEPQRRTTDGFELALPVLFFSGIQHFGITPSQIAEQPEFVKEYLRMLPTTWDETLLVDGYPGKFAVLARRAGDTWYVAAINGEDSVRELSLDLAFAGNGEWTLLTDGDEGLRQTTVPTDDGSITLTLPPQGGAVLWKER